MATHSSILAWRILWTKRSLVGYSLSGNKESDTTEHTHDCMKFFFFFFLTLLRFYFYHGLLQMGVMLQ